ncbi:YkuS family protein [Alicyclobacillus sp. ALC3]|uniref:YkuS family protein n=1 Tax=Alicyclobacillus sp. ALC3 TaxID=2796143 RepID=UPI0023791EF9|nr:YkuS family protein [Alicyclobacillus sp. ALC3]WDL98730.1 YkuS family protein [Alicyclobacillus sp. ALC3]
MKQVAVEPALNNVKEYLESQGCSCVETPAQSEAATASTEASAGNVCCYVVTGADQNLMGMQDVVANVPVINADGMSPQQVYDRVKEYMS